MLLAAIPLYITELVPPRGRGWLVDQVAIWNVFGYVSASWVGFGFYFYHGNGNEWRPPLCKREQPFPTSPRPLKEACSFSNSSCHHTFVRVKMDAGVTPVVDFKGPD